MGHFLNQRNDIQINAELTENVFQFKIVGRLVNLLCQIN